ncbi:MAG: glycosyltransferase family 4 protein [Acidobacteriota bacterium]|nr:glycosyltransferase family 4 protein [Acidobacteriota bacterium]
MRILFVSNIFPPHVRGGYELGCERIAEQCREVGHDVAVATSAVIGKLEKTVHNPQLRVEELFEPVYEYEPDIFDRTILNPVSFSRRQAAFGGTLQANAWALARFIREMAPELIWIFNPLGVGTVGVLEACLTSHAPCVLHLMDDIDHEVSIHQSECYLLPRYARVKSSIHAIACSEKMAIANTRVGEFASLRIIPNGVDFPKFPIDMRRDPAAPARFVYFGQVEESKGVLDALRGFRVLLDREPECDATFDVLGAGSSAFRRQLESEINRMGLRERVSLPGYIARADLMANLSSYTAAVLPLRDAEPFGYAPVEAGAAGLPVIVTTGPGAAEFFPPGYPLFVRDRQSAGEIGERLHWCVANPGATVKLGRHLQSELRRNCDFAEVVFPAYERAVKSLPPNETRYDIRATLAAHQSASLYRYSYRDVTQP